MIDVDAYDAVRLRLERVVSVADPRQAVPACPGWSVGDVLAHLVGLCEDWVEGRFDGYASEAWTSAHLVRHRGESCTSLLERWRATMKAFAAIDDSPLGATPARWAFGDAVVHEADLRSATTSGRVPEAAVELGVDRARWRAGRRRCGRWGWVGVRVVLPDGRELRTGPPEHDVDIEVAVHPYEVFRGLAGRRSAAQVAGWSWSGDPGPYLAAGPPYPFRWARTPIVD